MSNGILFFIVKLKPGNSSSGEDNYYMSYWIWVLPSIVHRSFTVCTLTRNVRRIAHPLHVQWSVQDFVCDKASLVVSLLTNMNYFHHSNGFRGCSETHPNVQPKHVWEKWLFEAVGLAALLAIACPNEALSGKQSGEHCGISLWSYREYWLEDFVNSGVCGDG